MAESMKVKFKKNGKVVMMAKSVAEIYIKKGRVEAVKLTAEEKKAEAEAKKKAEAEAKAKAKADAEAKNDNGDSQ